MSDDVARLAHRLLAWERADESAGHSMARVERRPGGGHRCHGVEVLADPSEVLACWLRVDVDSAWITREVEVRTVADDGERALSLSAGDDRRWLVDGTHRPDLDGCLDVDVAATPLTNTFPVRRLAHLAPGEEVTTAVAWVDVPSLTVTRVDQTYRRLPDVGGRASWEYRDEAHGRFVLRVDGDGLVEDYEGFARRVAATDWG